MTDLGSVLVEAATIMITGMVVVFAFLSILIFLVQLLAKIAPADPEVVNTPTPAQAAEKSSDTVQPEIIAAISAAVNQYRQRRA
ncbi:oxaloacetate decarboxylase subunit gamma [Photobacterium kagoshimensis]|uniref:oxaloacetate decarboxylase subunit gamma n=1 Tax=Photobacterium kagoshimensis TaxID=2910242 RepID=UPI003D132ED6